MQNKKLKKMYSAIAVAAMTAMIAAPFSVFAAETMDEDATISGNNAEGIDPTAEDDPTTTEIEAYADTEIDVWGYTEDATVYSVDVEWGAMTFQYQLSTWDPETHMKDTSNAGWKIYDTAEQKVLDATQDAINKVTVTNHSNAPVYAQMSYAGETDYTDTIGTFAASDKASEENVKATWDDSGNYFTLQTAATDKDGAAVADDEAGAPAVGNVYFTPKDIKPELKKADGIAKWTKIGKITVAIKTDAPTAATP